MFRVRIVPEARTDWAREARIIELASQGILKTCAEYTTGSLERNAPVHSGRMLGALTEAEGPHRTAGGGWVGVGNLDKLGHPSQKAPRGTIKAFLEWYRGKKPRRHAAYGARYRRRLRRWKR